MTGEREDVEAGDYIEDDPKAWEAVVLAVNRYAPRYDAIRRSFGEDAGDILAGAMLSYLASEHGVFVRSAAQPELDPVIATEIAVLRQVVEGGSATVDVSTDVLRAPLPPPHR